MVTSYLKEEPNFKRREEQIKCLVNVFFFFLRFMLLFHISVHSINQKDKIYIYIQWGKKVFSQPPIVQVLSLKKMREACNFHHRYTSTMRDKIRKKNPENKQDFL